MQGFTSPAKGISDGEFTTSQEKCVYKTGARRSRGILEQWSVGNGIPKHRKKMKISLI